MAFAKLDSKITSSSIWDQDDHIVRVWIAFLAEKDENGYVRGTFEAMKRISNIKNDHDGKKYEEAINHLESPDLDSRNKDFDGRRIQRVDGGWIVLNHENFKLHDRVIREQTRERVRKFREKHKVTHGNVTDALPSVSVSGSVSEKEGGLGEGRKKRDTKLFGDYVKITDGEYEKLILRYGQGFTDTAIREYGRKIGIGGNAASKHKNHYLGIIDYVERGYICAGAYKDPGKRIIIKQKEPPKDEESNPMTEEEIEEFINKPLALVNEKLGKI